MEGGGATPGHQLNRRRPIESCARASRLNAELLDRVETGLDTRDTTSKPVDIRYAIEQHLGRAYLHAIGSGIACANHAGRQIEQRGDLAAIERQVVDTE